MRADRGLSVRPAPGCARRARRTLAVDQQPQRAASAALARDLAPAARDLTDGRVNLRRRAAGCRQAPTTCPAPAATARAAVRPARLALSSARPPPAGRRRTRRSPALRSASHAAGAPRGAPRPARSSTRRACSRLTSLRPCRGSVRAREAHRRHSVDPRQRLVQRALRAAASSGRASLAGLERRRAAPAAPAGGARARPRFDPRERHVRPERALLGPVPAPASSASETAACSGAARAVLVVEVEREQARARGGSGRTPSARSAGPPARRPRRRPPPRSRSAAASSCQPRNTSVTCSASGAPAAGRGGPRRARRASRRAARAGRAGRAPRTCARGPSDRELLSAQQAPQQVHAHRGRAVADLGAVARQADVAGQRRAVRQLRAPAHVARPACPRCRRPGPATPVIASACRPRSAPGRRRPSPRPPRARPRRGARSAPGRRPAAPPWPRSSRPPPRRRSRPTSPGRSVSRAAISPPRARLGQRPAGGPASSCGHLVVDASCRRPRRASCAWRSRDQRRQASQAPARRRLPARHHLHLAPPQAGRDLERARSPRSRSSASRSVSAISDSGMPNRRSVCCS